MRAHLQVSLRDLDGWPLLPSLDGRLVYVAHRRAVVALPHQLLAAALASIPTPSGNPTQGQVGGQAQGQAQAQAAPLDGHSAPVRLADLGRTGALPPPWDALLRALHAAGVPLLDPRFAARLSALCDPQVRRGGGYRRKPLP
jgi:hypothetical protein